MLSLFLSYIKWFFIHSFWYCCYNRQIDNHINDFYYHYHANDDDDNDFNGRSREYGVYNLFYCLWRNNNKWPLHTCIHALLKKPERIKNHALTIPFFIFKLNRITLYNHKIKKFSKKILWEWWDFFSFGDKNIFYRNVTNENILRVR